MNHPLSEKTEQRPLRIVLLALSALLVAIHFYGLTDFPTGQYHDESSLAYNAHSLAEYGTDEYGTSWPLFFRAFDNYFDPLIVYTLLPFYTLSDLSLAPLRLLNALIFMLSACAFALLCLLIFPQRRWAYLGFCLYALMPWTFPLSRIALGGNNYMLLSLNLGLVFLIRTYQTRSNKAALLCALSFGIGLYSYHIARPFFALFLLATALSMYPDRKHYTKVASLFSAILLALALPLFFYLFSGTSALTHRFAEVSLWHQSQSLGHFAFELLKNYLGYFDPRFLFFHGDINLRHHTGLGGQLFLFMAPLILVGLYRNIKSLKASAVSRLVFLGLVLSPLPAALTADPMHGPRSMHMMIFYLLFALYGAEALLDRIKEKKLISILMLLLMTFECSLYIKDYFSEDYQRRLAPFMHEHINRALHVALEESRGEDVIHVSRSAFPFADAQFKPHIYSHMLFHTKISPQDYQRSGLSARIRPYNQNTAELGLLLRANLVPAQGNPDQPFRKNGETLPMGAILVQRLPIGIDTLAYYTFLPHGEIMESLNKIGVEGFAFEIWRIAPAEQGVEP